MRDPVIVNVQEPGRFFITWIDGTTWIVVLALGATVIVLALLLLIATGRDTLPRLRKAAVPSVAIASVLLLAWLGYFLFVLDAEVFGHGI